MSNICTLYVIIGSGPGPGNSLESPDSVRNPDFEKTWSKFHHYNQGLLDEFLAERSEAKNSKGPENLIYLRGYGTK